MLSIYGLISIKFFEILLFLAKFQAPLASNADKQYKENAESYGYIGLKKHLTSAENGIYAN
jgi:hypothetical protein